MNSAAGECNIYGKWMKVCLNKGKYGTDLTKTLFSLKNQSEMWRIHTVEEVDQNPRYNSHFNGYGLGWGLSDEKVILKFHTPAVYQVCYLL
jgi:hypothetical protein